MADSGRHTVLAFAAGAALGAGALYLYTREAERSQQPVDGSAAAQAAGGGGGAVAAAGSGGGSATLAAQPSPAAPVDMSHFDEDEILEEQLTRNVQFFGLEAQRRIGGAFVVVVGLGVSGGLRLEMREGSAASVEARLGGRDMPGLSCPRCMLQCPANPAGHNAVSL